MENRFIRPRSTRKLSLYPLRKRNTMNFEEMIDSMPWAEDLGGMSFDELRDLPYQVQANLDIAVFE